MRGNAAEILVGLEVPRHLVTETTRFRSTWLVASQNALRDCGFFDRYIELLPEAHREALLTPVVGKWLDGTVVLAHYTACEQLALSAEERVTIARTLVRPGMSTLFAVTGHLARQVGVTPWTPLAYARRLWERLCVGGAVAVYKEGPKEVRVELLGLTLAAIPYFRLTLRELALLVGSMFCRTLYVREIYDPAEPTTLVYRGSWV